MVAMIILNKISETLREGTPSVGFIPHPAVIGNPRFRVSYKAEPHLWLLRLPPPKLG